MNRGSGTSRCPAATASKAAWTCSASSAVKSGSAAGTQLEQVLAVAMEVRQSLLPGGDPSVAALDVAGHSKYCNNTGGDYYDFIDVAQLGESSPLLAVGDVVGHGIAAALLMASARAALRTRSLDRPGRAGLMTRTNDVLCAGNRHNWFMTLLLPQVDGRARSARWASAGHDPAIV